MLVRFPVRCYTPPSRIFTHPISNPWVVGRTAASSHPMSSFVDVLCLIGPNLHSLSLGPQSGFDANAPSSDPQTKHVDVDQEISPHIHSHTSSFRFLLIIVHLLLLSPPASYICSMKFHSVFVCLQVIHL